MANVINWAVTLGISGTGINIAGSASTQVNQSGVGHIGGLQAIATSATALTFGTATVTSGGMVALINTDTTNYVEVDCVNTFNSGAQQKLLAGQGIILRPEAATWYAKANTATVELMVVAVTA